MVGHFFYIEIIAFLFSLDLWVIKINNRNDRSLCEFCGSEITGDGEFCEFCGKSTYDTSRNYVETRIAAPELSQQTIIQGRIITDQEFENWVSRIGDLRKHMLSNGARAIRIDSVVWEIEPKKVYRFEFGESGVPSQKLVNIYADNIIEYEVKLTKNELKFSGGDFDPVTRYWLPLNPKSKDAMRKTYGKDIFSNLVKLLNL